MSVGDASMMRVTAPENMPAPEEVFGLRPEAWDVLGTLVTTLAFAIAAVGAWVAYRQLRHNQAARLDQTRPYVLVTADINPTMLSLIDIVVENVGAGPARDVEIKVNPPLRRVKEIKGVELSESPLFTQPVPMLPPGFKMQTFFDDARDRQKADVPSRHDVTLTYNDGHGHEWTETSVLDFTLMEGLLFSEVYGTHHAASALREIRDVLKRSKTIKGSPIHVTTESRDAYVQRQRDQHEEHERRVQEFRNAQDRQREEQADPNDSTDD